MEELQPVFEVPGDVPEEKPRGRKKRVEEMRIEKTEVSYMGEFVKVGENWIPSEPGDMIEGYVGIPYEIDTDFGKAKAVTVGNKRVLISAGLQLLPQLERQYVRITFTGMEKSKKRKGKEFKKFDLEVREE